MKRHRHLFQHLVCILVFIAAFAVAAEAKEPLSSLGTELQRPDGRFIFVGETEILDLLHRSFESLDDGSGIFSDQQRAHELTQALIQRTIDQQSRLDDEGCLKPLFASSSQEEYLLPAESFDNPEMAGLQTPLHLVKKAPEVLIVRVIAVETGLLGRDLGTLIQFEVDEWIKSDASLDELGEPTFFFSTDVWLTVGDKLYCERRPNIQRPKPFDQFIVFGSRSHIPQYFLMRNYFPISGGAILPQPYPMMDDRFPIDLEQLKEAAE